MGGVPLLGGSRPLVFEVGIICVFDLHENLLFFKVVESLQ
jgi:hypothetical protein